MSQRFDYAGHWLETYCSSYLNLVLLRAISTKLQAVMDAAEEQRNDLRQTHTMLAVCVHKLGDRVVIGSRDVARIRGYHLHAESSLERQRVVLEMTNECTEHDDDDT